MDSPPKCSSADDSYDSDEPPELELNIPQLEIIASSIFSPSFPCTGVRKLTRGQYHEVFVLSFDQNAPSTSSPSTCIARFPRNPSSSFVEHSAVATMRYVRQHTTIPVPQIYHVSSEAESASVGAPFVLMQCMPGVHLYKLWDQIAFWQKLFVVYQIAKVVAELGNLQFDKIGMLADSSDGIALQGLVSPAHPGGRREHGPWESVEEWLGSFIGDDKQHDNTTTTSSSSSGLLVSVKHHLHAFLASRSKDPSLQPPFGLLHTDFDAQNLLFTKEPWPRLTAVIDWDYAHTAPKHLIYDFPVFLQNDPYRKEAWADNKELRWVFVLAILEVNYKEAAVSCSFTGKSYLLNRFISVFMTLEAPLEEPERTDWCKMRETLVKHFVDDLERGKGEPYDGGWYQGDGDYGLVRPAAVGNYGGTDLPSGTNLAKDSGRGKGLEYRRSLAGGEKTQERYHPSTFNTVNNMASVISNEEKYKQDLDPGLYGLFLPQHEGVYGEYNPPTLGTFHDIASMFFNQGENNKALEWYGRALAGRVKTLGEDHPDILNIVHNMASVFSNKALEATLSSSEPTEQVLKDIDPASGSPPITAVPNFPSTSNAIGLAQDLPGEEAQKFLGSLLRVRDLATGGNRPEQANMGSGPQNAVAIQSLGVLRNMEDEVGAIQALFTTFEGTGDIDYLDNAIGMTEKLAAKVTPEELVPTVTSEELAPLVTPMRDTLREFYLSLLTRFLSARCKRTGGLEDIDKAIKWMEVAVAEIPPDHSDRAGMLSDLGNQLSSRYERLGDLQDLEQAIKCAEEAVAATPLGHSDRARMLNNLGSWLGSRYERFGDLQDLEQAIKRAEEAVAATPLDHSDHAAVLNNLGNRFSSRYSRLGDLQDLEQATKCAEEAVAALHPDNPDRALVLNTLITNLTSRYQRTNSIRDFYYILRISYEAWHCRFSPPKDRIRAAHRAGLLLTTRNMWQESSPLLDEAVKMLPKISSRSLRRGDQEHHLSDFTRLASEAVSIAFQAGAEAAHCLRLLEFGRGIITGLIIDCRSDLDLSKLQSNQPGLFDKFHELRIEVDCPLVMLETDNDESYQQKRRRREEAVQELEETLNSIRKLPGLEGFQLPPRSDDLMAIAGEGPIVIFNSTKFRSDAIIVTSSTIKALVLPKLVYKSVQERMSQIPKLVRGRRKTYQWRNERMEEILLWLWDVAVEPVFDALKMDELKVDTAAHHKLPRIWWIGVGLLAMAPFHAAGDYSPKSTRNTISRAISSYIPTIKALSYARQKKLNLLSRADSRLLLVSMPTIPSFTGLKSAEKEVGEIIHAVNGKASTTPLKHPSKADVLALLPSYHAVHFACHGVSDSRNPSDSHLVLCNNGDSTPDRLTVGAISNTNIKHAQIAYLSACSTAENATASLVDESIYIASGFQLAGFSHVLATQWASNDEACLKVAKEFYSLLFDGKGEKGHQKVSASFHSAVEKLRDKNLRQPILWACYIHTGA